MTFSRTRGDDYPFTFIIKYNGELMDLAGSDITFSYKNDNEPVRSIIANTSSGGKGEAIFVPTSGVDFMTSGTYTFDVQRVSNGYTYTHLKGTLILEGDVTP